MKTRNIYFLTFFQKKRSIKVTFDDINKINVHNAGTIQDKLSGIVSKPYTNLVLDVKNIAFIDTAGFNMLNDVAKIGYKHDSSVEFKNVGAEVSELIELVKKHYQFTIKYI